MCNDGTRYTKDIDIVRKCACTKKCYWLTEVAIHNSNTPSHLHIETAHHEPQHAAMTDDQPDQHVLNLKPSVPPSPDNEPYKLTFIVENETKESPVEVTQFIYPSNQAYGSDQTTDGSSVYKTHHAPHDSYCLLSAFLYFITITTFAYLVILWIRQKMHMQMEMMQWW